MKRRREPLTLVLGLLIALWTMACGIQSEDSMPPVLRSGEARLATKNGGVYVEEPERVPLRSVDHVVDGDTLVVIEAGRRERVRAYGMAAPESDERCGPEATARLVALAGTEVRVLTDRRLEDQFDRQLRYLFTPEGRSIEAALIQEGLARAWRDDGAFRSKLIELEAAARFARRGCLWSGS